MITPQFSKSLRSGLLVVYCFAVACCSRNSFGQITGVSWEVDRVFYAEDTVENPDMAPLYGMVSYLIYADVTNPND